MILGGSDEDRLDGVKGQRTNPIEMAAQSELRVPCLPHGILIVANLSKKKKNISQFTK